MDRTLHVSLAGVGVSRAVLALLAVLLAVPRPVGAQPARLFPASGHIADVGGNLLVGGTLLDPTTGAVVHYFAASTGHWAVASAGGKVAIGLFDAAVGGTQAGEVRVFDAATRALLLVVPNPTPANFDFFGDAVAFVGGNLLVGAHGDDGGGMNAGAAYLFDGTSGALLRTFTEPTPGVGHVFGGSVAALGGDVLIGAPAEAGGAAYRFDATTGALLQTYVAPPGGGGQLGVTIAAFGGNVVVGASLDDTAGSDAGAVYLFDSTTGAVVRTLLPTGRFGHLGASLAVAGSWIIAGAPNTTIESPGFVDLVGAAYVFDGVSGALLRRIDNPTPGYADFFGSFVGAIGNALFVADPDGTFEFCGGASGCQPCETCGAGGSCVVAPDPGCRTPPPRRRFMLRLKNTTGDATDGFLWKGSGTVIRDNIIQTADFADPTSEELGHDYSLCLYDESTSTPSLLFRATAPAGGDCDGRPCWEGSGRPYDLISNWNRIRYRDRSRTPEGVDLVLLTLSSPTTGSLVMKGVGPNLSSRPFGLPSLPLPLPLRAQLQVHDGVCWEAEYPSAQVNTAERFRATSE